MSDGLFVFNMVLLMIGTGVNNLWEWALTGEPFLCFFLYFCIFNFLGRRQTKMFVFYLI